MIRTQSSQGIVRNLVGGLALFGTSLLSLPAHAGIGACGDIDVEANAECEVAVEGGCEAQCKPVSFELACAAELQTDCSGSTCNLKAEASCTTSCQVDCLADCEVDPGEFDCEGSCTGSCEADCSGQCESANNHGECEASCKANCSTECSGQCSGTPPKAECSAKCESSCKGECTAKVNAECQIDCQADGYATCEEHLEGGCNTQCTEPDGALFCDGQYVDHGGNLDECIDALNAYLAVHVDASARGSSMGSCEGNGCSAEAEGEAKASCSVSNPGSSAPYGAGWILGSLGLAALASRRRTRL